MSFKQFLVAEAKTLAEGSGQGLSWFNPRTKKFIQVTTEWHDWEIIKNPKKFGLTKAKVLEIDPHAEENMDRGRDIFPKLRKHLQRLGFVKVRFVPPMRSTGIGSVLNLDAATLPFVAKAATAWHRQFPDPEQVYLDYGNKYHVISGTQFRGLARTGKIPTASKIAAVR